MSISRELRDHHERRPSQYTVTSNDHIEVVVALIDTEIIGALLGASVATFAGAAVSRWSIRYDRRLAACSAMQTLADEADSMPMSGGISARICSIIHRLRRTAGV
jgi:hypothetical protein